MSFDRALLGSKVARPDDVTKSQDMEKSGDVHVQQPVQQVQYSCSPGGFVSLSDEWGRAVSPVCKPTHPPPVVMINVLAIKCLEVSPFVCKVGIFRGSCFAAVL